MQLNPTAYMYSKLPNLVFGFHGCNKETFENVILKNEHLKKSENAYDWLGNGIYFWENSYQRAFDWAKQRYKDDACVIGAILDLGYCLNLTDYASSEVLKNAYISLENDYTASNLSLPQNKNIKNSDDWLLRNLDCAVIEYVHAFNKANKLPEYDSVRGIFTEGKSLYPGAGFKEKTHVQICVTNPNCIKGYFNPIPTDTNYKQP